MSGMGQTVKALRESKGMSQTLLAGLAGVDVKTIQLIEDGTTTNATLRTLRGIATALGIKASVLVDGDESAA